MIFTRREKYWHEDKEHLFRIDHEVVSSYFNKTQRLNFSKQAARREEETILRHLNATRESDILDLGAGDGRWARLLIPCCKLYVGVDLSATFIEKARNKYRENNAQFICMPAQNYYADRQYDIILAIGLITYMNDDDIEKMAYNCSRMLKVGGKLFVRSVALKETGKKRKIFKRNSNLLLKMFRKPSYQIIRRTFQYEISLFSEFCLLKQIEIPDTAYTLYIFEKDDCYGD